MLDSSTPPAAAISVSERIFASSEIAIVMSAEHGKNLDPAAAAPPVPVLIDGEGVTQELQRLGVKLVAHPQEHAPANLPEGTSTVTIDPATTDGGGMPEVRAANEPARIALLTGTAEGAHDEQRAAQNIAMRNVHAATGAIVELPGGDPREAGAMEALGPHLDGTILAVGEQFGTSDQLAQRLRVAASSPELPGGGTLALQGKIMIASYGHPGAPVLGVLGERDLEAAIREVKQRAEEYQALTQQRVVPTFELITTIASAHAGPDGNYSDEVSAEALRPWVERAGEEGIYVVLDLQPGTSSFPEQARQYEELLMLPHVGLALDPEWRLRPGERHLEQIGSVTIDEVNETSTWLAELCAAHGLPQKVFVVHQFASHMIEGRERLDTSRDELAVLIHVDGHGTPPLKMETWHTLLEGLPAGTALGWKNFIDEDTPMLTPAETLAIEPLPAFISYQ